MRKRRNPFTRLTAVLLSFIMLIGMMPMTVLAEGDNSPIGKSGYEQLMIIPYAEDEEEIGIVFSFSAEEFGLLKVGEELDFKATFTLTGSVYANPILPTYFFVGNLPGGLYAQPAVRVDDTTVEVRITGRLTTAATGSFLARYNTISGDQVLADVETVPISGDSYYGDIVKGDGTAVFNPPIEESKTHNSIVVHAVANAGASGQSVEYAISTMSGAVPTSGWQTSEVFTGLVRDTIYYVYARTEGNANYTTGPAQQSAAITTNKEPVTWEYLGANGASAVQTSGLLTLLFDKDPGPLTLTDIDVEGATKGILQGSGNTRILTISDITVENEETITVILDDPEGYEITPTERSVTIYKKKEVQVGTQNGTVSENKAGSVTYPVNTANIVGGIYSVTMQGAPTGVTVENVSLSTNTGVLKFTTTNATPQGSYSLTITIDGIVSNTFTLVVNPPIVAVSAVAVSPASVIEMKKGSTPQQFTAVVSGENNPTQNVIWSIEGAQHPGTKIVNGLLTVDIDEPVYSLVIRATSAFDPSKSGTATVTLVDAIEVTAVAVSPEAVTELRKGSAARQFNAAVIGLYNPPQDVTWSLEGAQHPGTGIANGLLTVHIDEPSYALVVRATSVFDPSKSGTATVTLVDAITVHTVTVSPASIVNMEKGSVVRQFTAAVSGLYNPPQTVIWSVEGAKHPETTVVNGQLFVHTDEPAYTLVVRATSDYDPSKSGTATVTLIDAPRYGIALNIVGTYVFRDVKEDYEERKLGSVTVTNVGNRPTGALTVSIADGIFFELNAQAITNLQPGESAAFTTRPHTGLLAGRYTDVITVSGGSEIAPQRLNLRFVVEADDGDGGGGYGANYLDRRYDNSYTVVFDSKKPNQPTIGSAAVPADQTAAGKVTWTATESHTQLAMNRATELARAKNKLPDGIGAALSTAYTGTITTVDVIIPQATMKKVVDNNVKLLSINAHFMTITFDTDAVRSLQKQSDKNKDIIVRVTPKNMGNTRVGYDVVLTTTKDGKPVQITALDSGRAIVSLHYTLGKTEAPGYLYAVYNNAAGKLMRLTGSVYDANSGGVIFATTRFHAFGVAYASSVRFDDIREHWAKESIDYAMSRGFFPGISGSQFAPDTVVSRSMLAVALGKMAGADVSGYTKSSFSDVEQDAYYMPYVEWAHEKGIIRGTVGKEFAPNRTVMREEMATILMTYARVTGFPLPFTRETANYADSGYIHADHKYAVLTMQQAGIMMGKDANNFQPQTGVTRAEVAVILARYSKLRINPATAQSWALNDVGQWYYYDYAGKALANQQKIGNVPYHFYSSGALRTGWVSDGADWYYYTGNQRPTKHLPVSTNLSAVK